MNEVFDNSGVLFRHGFESRRGNCYKVKEFEAEFAKKMNAPYALGVTSGTAALRVALAALGIAHGDEVVTQAFTFVATVEAIIEAGATPICTDIDDTFNMSVADLKQKITSKTKAIIAVHMLGGPADIREIRRVANDAAIPLIEDTAWGCGGHVDKIALGSWGDIGTYSFDFAKTITTGEGGMMIFKDEILYKKAAAWHDHGHENNPDLPRWKDSRSSSGFNYRMMELQAAVGIAQLRKLEDIVERQRNNKQRLWDALSGVKGISKRAMPSGSYETADALILNVGNAENAQRCRRKLLEVGVGTKILPEALTWHFAGEWEHMKELAASSNVPVTERYLNTRRRLESSIAIPITIENDEETVVKVGEAIGKALEKSNG